MSFSPFSIKSSHQTCKEGNMIRNFKEMSHIIVKLFDHLNCLAIMSMSIIYRNDIGICQIQGCSNTAVGSLVDSRWNLEPINLTVCQADFDHLRKTFGLSEWLPELEKWENVRSVKRAISYLNMIHSELTKMRNFSCAFRSEWSEAIEECSRHYKELLMKEFRLVNQFLNICVLEHI